MRKALPPAFWACVFLVFLTPMELGDVWWHLATGQWIWEHGALPNANPFSSTPTSSASAGFVLKGFWLFQLAAFGIERAFGLAGLVCFKAATFALTFFVMSRTLRSFGLGGAASHLLVLPAVFVATYYDEARPQTASFLFFALVLHVLEKARGEVREGGTPKALLPLPALMLVWANVHPGFVVGLALMAAYAAESLLRAASGRAARQSLFYAAFCLAALPASLLNPNGIEALGLTRGMLATSASGAAPIHEHLSIREFASYTGQSYLSYAIYAVIAGGGLSFLYRPRRADVLRLALFLAFAYTATETFRAGLFFAVLAVACAGGNLSRHGRTASAPRGRAWAWAAPIALASAALLLVPRTVLRKPAMDDDLFPMKAASFVEGNRLPGNLFHPYEWGGYIIWRLHPGYGSFIDGRAIGPMDEYSEVLSAGPRWKEVLAGRGVNTVLYWPLLPYEGRVPPLVFALIEDDGWRPAYWDLQSVVFVRAGTAGPSISRAAVWDLLQSLITANIAAAPGTARNYSALGELYLERGLRQDAGRAFEQALALDPGDEAAAFWLKALGRGR